MHKSARSERKLIYCLTVSLDGYINGPNGELDWHVVDDEFLEFIHGLIEPIDTFLFGRRMYEAMTFWDTAEDDTSLSELDRAFARRWNQQLKIVFSNSLDHVQGTARLASGTLEEELRQLRSTPGGLIEVSGPNLAAQAMAMDLIDEYHLFISPVVVGGGSRCFPESANRTRLHLNEMRRFESGVVYVNYIPDYGNGHNRRSD